MKEFKLLILFTIEYVCNLIRFALSLVCGVFHIIEKLIEGIGTGFEKIELKCLKKRMDATLTVEPAKENAKNK